MQSKVCCPFHCCCYFALSGPDGVSYAGILPEQTSPLLVTEAGLDFELRIRAFPLNQPSSSTRPILCERLSVSHFKQSSMLYVSPASRIPGCLSALTEGGFTYPYTIHITPGNLSLLSPRAIYLIYGFCNSTTEYVSPTVYITGRYSIEYRVICVFRYQMSIAL